MLLINNLKLSLDTDFSNLKPLVEKLLKCKLTSVKLHRKSVDARRKNDVHFCCSVLVECENEGKILKFNKNATPFTKKEYVWQKCNATSFKRPVVVGFGPAGMFCALTLAKAGLKPIVIERGGKVEERTKAVKSFFEGGKLDPESNIQFGEGGAGTFSDGKLTTGIKNPRCATVIEVLNQMGAGDNILTDAKPHIGTDVLVDVVRNIREKIISLGGEILFNTRLDEVVLNKGNVTSIKTNKGEIPCEILVLATGHSARDTYKMILNSGADMVQKPFAVGVRIEHAQEDINKALYGEFYNHKNLSAADYKLACHLENGRGVYTFCMCPGGEVVPSASEEGGVVTNGMSLFARDGKNANSALLVNVTPQDLEGDDVLEGCSFQRSIEEKAYNITGGFCAPCETVGNFLYKNGASPDVSPTYSPGIVMCDLDNILPGFVTDAMREAIPLFDKKLKGFADDGAVLTAPETRSSSPVRILRDEITAMSNIDGVYPCGEGAGYAGGIMTAAVDGIKTAEAIVRRDTNA